MASLSVHKMGCAPDTYYIHGTSTDLPLFFVLAADYGSIFALQMMHQTIIVLNTPTAIKDVIERKSISTSNRPESHIADMIIPNNENFGMSTDRE